MKRMERILLVLIRARRKSNKDKIRETSLLKIIFSSI